MNNEVLRSQLEIDNIKDQLNEIDAFVVLSGLGGLPEQCLVNPYLVSMATGIRYKLTNEEPANVRSFGFEFKGLVHKQRTDKTKKKKPYGKSNCTRIVSRPIPSGSRKPYADYTSGEINELAEAAKIENEIELDMLKMAESHFLDGNLKYFGEQMDL